MLGQVFPPVPTGPAVGTVVVMKIEPGRVMVVEPIPPATAGERRGRAGTTVVIAGRAAVDFLRRRWPQLYTSTSDATPYQSPGWLLGWAEQSPATSTTLVIASYRGGDLVAALALTRERIEGRRFQIRPLSSPHAEDVRVLGPGADDLEITASLISVLAAFARGGDQVVVPDLRGEVALGRALASAPGWEHSEAGYASVPLPLDLGAMPAATRKAHRRRAGRLAALAAEGHHLTYRRSRTAEELVAAYRELADLHERQWGVPLPDAAAWPGVLSRCGPGLAFVATLDLDHRPVAAQLCLVRGRTCYSLRTARTPDQGRLAFGHALLRWLATDLAGDGYTALDLGRTIDGQHRYKDEYGPDWSKVLTVRSVGPRPDGPGSHGLPRRRRHAAHGAAATRCEPR